MLVEPLAEAAVLEVAVAVVVRAARVMAAARCCRVVGRAAKAAPSMAKWKAAA